MAEHSDRLNPHEGAGESLEVWRQRASEQHSVIRRSLGHIVSRLSQLAANAAASDVALNGLREAVVEFDLQLQRHFAKEETLLFPAFQALAAAAREEAPRPALPFPTVLHPIRVMEAEHVRIETAVDRVRRVASEQSVDAAHAAAWRWCVAELSQLEADLCEHHRAENEFLFPLALEVEGRLL